MAEWKKLKCPKGIRQRGESSFQIRYKNQRGESQEETFKGSTPEEALGEAVRQLDIRRGDIARGILTTSKPHTVTFMELCADVVNYYGAKKLKSFDDIEGRYRLHLIPFFGKERRAMEINTADWYKYIEDRRHEGAADGTIERELEAGKRAYKLAMECDPPKIHRMPKIPMLHPKNVRKGFFERERLDPILHHLPNHLIDPPEFAYNTGWRKTEVMSRTTDHVDWDARVVRMEPGETKNGEGREFPITDELEKILKRVWPEGPAFGGTLLFRTPEGKPIKSFDKAWATACRKAGAPVRWIPLRRGIPLLNDDGTPQRDEKGKKLYKRDAKGQLILEPVLYKYGPKKGQPKLVCRAAVYFHDFRRTAYRNLVRNGVPPSVARGAVGWLDAKTAERYNITDKSDLDVLREKMNAAAKMVKKTRLVVNSRKQSS